MGGRYMGVWEREYGNGSMGMNLSIGMGVWE